AGSIHSTRSWSPARTCRAANHKNACREVAGKDSTGWGAAHDCSLTADTIRLSFSVMAAAGNPGTSQAAIRKETARTTWSHRPTRGPTLSGKFLSLVGNGQAIRHQH